MAFMLYFAVNVFYILPKEKDARERWLRNCDVLPPYEFSKSAKICALHFAEEAFSTPKTETVRRRRLRKNAEPSFRVEFAWYFFI